MRYSRWTERAATMRSLVCALLASLSLTSVAGAQAPRADGGEPADWPLAHLSLSFGVAMPFGSDGFNEGISELRYARSVAGGYAELAFDGALADVELSPTGRFRVLLGAAFHYGVIDERDATAGFFENLSGYGPRPAMWRHDLAGFATIAPAFVFANADAMGVELELQLGLGVGGRIWEVRGARESAPLLLVSTRAGVSFFEHGFSAGILVGYSHTASLSPVGPEQLEVSLNALSVGPRLGWRW